VIDTTQHRFSSAVARSSGFPTATSATMSLDPTTDADADAVQREQLAAIFVK
jgi:hypothetical protein